MAKPKGSLLSRLLHSRRSSELLPDDMLAELDRLGEDRAQLQRIADSEGIDYARFFLESLTASASRFDKWFPLLTQFATACRKRSPLPAESALTELNHAARRVLHPKIINDERVPQRNHFTAAVFTAPLAVLPLVMAEWPSTYRNAVFFTPEELCKWHEQYNEPEDGPWWYVLQHWDAEPTDSCWLPQSSGSVPANAIAVVVSRGLRWGSLAGGYTRELWAVGSDGESLVSHLGDITF